MGWMGKRGEYGAETLGRWVGISPFAFCADCGQPRKLLRNSSGAKSRGVSQEPASNPITSSPARASGSAATPPTAPSPMMTTSVFLRSMAMGAAFHGEHRVLVCRFAYGLRRFHALFVLADRHAQAGKTDQVPADEIGVAAVIGIAERALDRMGAHEIEEGRGFRHESGGDVLLHVGQDGVLIGCREAREQGAVLGLRIGVEGGEAGGISLAQGRQRTGEGPIDVMCRARLGGAGAFVVGADQPGDARL